MTATATATATATEWRRDNRNSLAEWRQCCLPNGLSSSSLNIFLRDKCPISLSLVIIVHLFCCVCQFVKCISVMRTECLVFISCMGNFNFHLMNDTMAFAIEYQTDETLHTHTLSLTNVCFSLCKCRRATHEIIFRLWLRHTHYCRGVSEREERNKYTE